MNIPCWCLCLVSLCTFIISGSITQLSAQSTITGGVINTYLQVLDVSDYGRKIYVADGQGINVSVGDWLLLIQNQGAASDAVPANQCDGPGGGVSSYDAAGNFELVRVKGVDLTPPAGTFALFDCIELEAPVEMFYYARKANEYRDGFPRGNYYGFQAVVVPYYNGDVEITGDVTADVWDGVKGGVFALAASGNVMLKADIDVDGKGFRGGAPTANNTSVDQTDYGSDPGDNYGGSKGEGIIDITLGSPDLNAGRAPYDESAGRGALANGGGGGNGKNAGGGGGSNYGAGGRGGKQNSAEDAPGTADDEDQLIGGEGGWALDYTDKRRTQIFFGGGGGGGHRSAEDVLDPDDSEGGAGGGIVLILADSLIIGNNERDIRANGSDGHNAGAGDNGAGGGGGGGAILLDVNEISVGDGLLNLQVAGGNGGNSYTTADQTGPGGGGGGGVVWLRSTAVPIGVNYNFGDGTISGGIEGKSVHNGIPASFGAEDGSDGAVFFGLDYPKWYDQGESPI